MKNKKGFTLVELVIVIAVIAILAGVMIGTFASVVKKAKESAKMQEMTAQKQEQIANDIDQKLKNAEWLGWSDFETKLAEAVSKAVGKGTWDKDEPVLVRVHSSCVTGDIFGSFRCECGEQLHEAMRMIDKEGKGVIVYMNQEGRGIGLMNKIAAYKLQEEGLDTVEANLHLGFKADERDYGVGANILREIGVTKMRLMSNNPIKRIGLESYGLNIVENVAIEVQPNKYNKSYLETKQQKMGHTLHVVKQ